MSSPIGSRRFGHTALGLLGALATLAATTTARAQVDIAPPLPNVLLLVDTSGSMEFKTNGTPVTCNPGNTALLNEKSRWINVVEVLSGTLNGYSCESIDRASNAFKLGEYQLITGTAPYDWRYPIPYHRPLSGGNVGCAPAPGTLPGTTPNTNPFIYPAGAVDPHPYANAAASCSMSQAGDGILDAFGTRVRFGLMTFDTEVNASRGFGGSDYTSANPDHPGGQAGLWSYVVGTAASGRPMGCSTPNVPQEVGARNGAAPAWEGRMINFGNPSDANTQARQTLTSRVKEVLLATRPFGATPIAGMLHDAEDFFWNDTSNDPAAAGATEPFDDYGPRNDPYLQCGREQLIILLTDGEPNMDLRPFCSDTPPNATVAAGSCPFDMPDTIANRLANPPSGTRKVIKTYVVGFALEQVDHDGNAGTAAVSCNSLVTPAPPLPPLTQPAPPALPVAPRVLSNVCNNPPASNVPLTACCNLWKIAIAGRGDAYFASNPAELRASISNILSRHVATTSRTQPVISGGGVAGGGSYRFFSGFEVGQLATWKGHLTRQRYVCEDDPNGGPRIPTPIDPDRTKADDFAYNVNNTDADERVFYTVVGKVGGTFQHGGETLRKGIPMTDPDGAGTLTPEVKTGKAVPFVAAVPPEALAIPTSAYPNPSMNAADVRDFFLKWLVGVNPVGDTFHRCKGPPDDCGLFGDIFHSTPQVVGAPSALLRDESYESFAIAQAKRPIMLYTSTNDGFLHAFKVTSNDPAHKDSDIEKVEATNINNELWAFAPPAVLPNLYGLYPYNHLNLLDGVPVVRDVVAIQPSSTTATPITFERTATDARGGKGTWRTVLVQSFGADYGGYFALDVTNPVPDPGGDTEKGGPRFLWQLTKEASGGKALFGRGGGTPAITTLFFDPSGGTNPREIPVAVLPGGPGGSVTSGICPGTPRTFSDVTLDPRFTPRGQVRCYDFAGGAQVGARSLTIVRLDTGQIIRTFRQSSSEVNSATLKGLVTLADIDSPITGQPVAFPGQQGAVADRILVGDQDGRLWKVNVASTKPAEWTMKLFFDLYPASISSVATHSFDSGQPIAVPPVLSVDDNGRMTVNVATGDQDSLGSSAAQTNYVYSLTEDTNAARTTAIHKVNWLKTFTNGERVVGPLALFNANVFFATFVASTGTSVCTLGNSKLWGMQYIKAASSGFQTGGEGALDDDGLPATADVQSIDRGSEFISGVSIAQQPSCYNVDPDVSGDDLVGYQGLMRISQVNPGKFELVVHKNQPAGSEPGQEINTETIQLKTPPSLSRIASWASIIE